MSRVVLGQRFGRLVVQGRVVAPGRASWKCICACGATSIIRGDHLLSGATASCGCLMRERVSKRRLRDLVGQRFGRLLVIGRAANKGCHVGWLCQCDCGEMREVVSSNLSRRHSMSCGCLCSEMRGTFNLTHGATRNRRVTPEFKSWSSAKRRCGNPKDAAYGAYGGRGVTFCAHWRHDFSAFLKDMGPRPAGTTLDRKDNDGNYEPGNCRWATRRMQANNRRSSRRLTSGEQTLTVAQWSRVTRIPQGTIRSRLRMGWTVERALAGKNPPAWPGRGKP